jgi:hypothetical protein
MKKLLMLSIVVVILLSAGTSFACHINFNPAQLENVNIGESVTVEAIVIKEHRKCELADDDVQVTLSANARIISQTGWEKVGANELHNTFEIQILNEGETTLRVFRECSKKGLSEGILTFQVVK